MRVQSIWATVEIRDPTRDGLFLPTAQMPFGEVDNVAELKDLTQEIGPMAEALEDTGQLLPAGFATPLVVNGGDIAGCVGIFDDLDFGFGVSHGF
jgi:hypothetical protein